MPPVEEQSLFWCSATNLDDIAAAGWVIASNGYGWWFEKQDADGLCIERQFPPTWVEQMIIQAEKRADAHARKEIRRALGLKK